MSRSCVLAIDQGTTGTTALLLDAAGRIRGKGYAELPQHYPEPGQVEHDGQEIWRSVLRAVSEARRAARVGDGDIAAIGITNQRETVLAWDRRTGKPLARAIVWQDRRTVDRCAALRRAGMENEIRRKTGLTLDPYFSATKIEWMLRRISGMRSGARSGRLAVGTVDSWLLWRLTGGSVHATDPTNASRTLVFDINRLAWDDRLCEVFGIPPAVLADVRPSSGIFGTTRGVDGLPDGIPIAGIAGDQQAALFGQGCVAAGECKNTYGTGAFLLVHTGRKRIASRAGLITTVACGALGEPAYALEGSVFIAGAVIQWLRDGLGILDSAPVSETLARSVEDSGGVTLVPAFVGLGAPYWRPEVRGAAFGLTRGVTGAHLARAALESIAFQSRDLLEAVTRDLSRARRVGRIRRLRVDGGASANNLLMQIQADLLGIPLERPRVIETTALGAGLLAGMATGFWSSHQDIAKARAIETTFTPRRTRGWRDAEYARWRKAVAMLMAPAAGR